MFGLLGVDGLRPIKPLNQIKTERLIIREATENDLLALQEIDKKLNDHLNASPIFLNRTIKATSLAEIKKDFINFINNDIKTIVAEKENNIISCMRGRLNKGPGCDIVQDVGTLGINFAYTNPDTRKMGAATHLLNELIKWGASKNMKRCTVDFESQNKEGEKFWLKYFKPICFSVMRKIDDRIKL